MNLYKLNAQNKNTNLYTRFYILFIRNQRKTTKKTDYRIITVSDRFHPLLVQTATTTRAWSVLFSGEDQTDRCQGAGWSNKLWQRGRHQQRSVFGVAMVRSGMRCSGMHAPVISKQGFLGVFSSLFWNFERKLFYI